MSEPLYEFQNPQVQKDAHGRRVRRRLANLTWFMSDMKWTRDDAMEAVCVWLAWEACKSEYADEKGKTRAKGAFLNKIKALYGNAFDHQSWEGGID